MKNKVLFITLAVLALILIKPIDVFSQGGNNPLMPTKVRLPIYIGPVFGYNMSQHSVELKSFATDPLCPTFVDGSDDGYYVGFSGEYILGDVRTSKSSILMKVVYNNLPAYLEKGGDTYPSRITIVDDQGNPVGEEIINSSTLHTQEIKYSLITVEAFYKFNPIQGMGLGFVVGPTFDFSLEKSHIQTMELIEPLNAQFKIPDDGIPAGMRYENNNRTIIVKDGDIPESSGFRFGVKAGIQYEILLGPMYIVPGAYYNFGVTNLSSQEDWRVNAIQMGIDIRFAL